MRKKLTTWRLNNTLLKKQRVSEKIKKEIKKYLKTNNNKETSTQNLWVARRAVLRGKLIAKKGLPQKRRKISN